MRTVGRGIGVVIVLMALYEALAFCGWLLNQPNDAAVAGAIVLGVIVLAGAWAAVRGLLRVPHALALVALALSVSACTRIPAGYVGVKVNNSGSDRGVQDYPLQTGVTWYNPFTQSVFEYPTYMQTVQWTHSTTEGNPTNEEITFTNADQMQIAADISLSYQLDPLKVPQFYVTFRSDDINFFTLGYMRNQARDKFNEVAGKYKIEQIMGDNAPMLAEVRRELQKEVAPLGVQLKQFGIIGAPRPPPAVQAAINLKVQANQIAIQKQNELAQSTADAQKEIARAEGHATAVVTTATAEAEANRKLSESLTATLVEYLRTQKWNGALPQVTGGGIPLLNLK